jgi:hypothetical protein
MKQFFLHIVSLTTLSALIICMSVGVAVLPECCQKAGEKLISKTDVHACHCHHDNVSVDHEESTMHSHCHCKVTIEKKDLMQHVPQEIVGAPICFKLPYTLSLHAPLLVVITCDWKNWCTQPHSPPDKVGRLKFFSTLII